MDQQINSILQRELQALQALTDQLGEDVHQCVRILQETKGNILTTGMGTSGTIARRMAHLLSCCGACAFFVHPADQQHGASGVLGPADVVVVFSKGGESTEINNFLQMAKDKGCTIIALTGRNESTMGGIVDHQVIFTVPEDSEPFGMIATTSSLAAALVVDVICTLLLEANGYTKEAFALSHPGGLVGVKARGDSR